MLLGLSFHSLNPLTIINSFTFHTHPSPLPFCLSIVIFHNRLEKDLEYRFNYLTKFLEFGAEDIDLIKGSAASLIPLVPAVVEEIFTKLFSFDITKVNRGKNDEE